MDEIPTSPKAPEPRSEEQKKDYSFTTNLTIWISGAVLLTLIMIVIACAVVSAKCQKRTKKNKKTAAASLGIICSLLVRNMLHLKSKFDQFINRISIINENDKLYYCSNVLKTVVTYCACPNDA